MTVSLAIAINVLAMLLLTAALSYVMTRAAQLTPHRRAARPRPGMPAAVALSAHGRSARHAVPAFASAHI
jgi:hypothetical protein